MRRIISFLPLAALFVLSTLSCDDEKESVKEDEQAKGPQVATLDAEKGPYFIATLSGRVSGLEDVALDFECGIEYSTDKDFSNQYSTRQKFDNKYTEESYSITVSGIQPGKKYYYRAYYINQMVLSYGEVKSFTFEWTTSEIEKSRGPVDLGLSVKWATCNVGATIPEQFGDYFNWGEPELYYVAGYAQEDPQAHWKEGYSSGYNWATYKFCNSIGYARSKYNDDSSYGIVDNKTILDPEDDAAYVNWGGNWRMPTKAEFSELCNSENCIWIWTTQNGVNGYLVTSKKTGYEDASIFLPAAGDRYNTRLDCDGDHGYYWSSSLCTGDALNAWGLQIRSDGHFTSFYERYYGFTVRPVCP